MLDYTRTHSASTVFSVRFGVARQIVKTARLQLRFRSGFAGAAADSAGVGREAVSLLRPGRLHRRGHESE